MIGTSAVFIGAPARNATHEHESPADASDARLLASFLADRDVPCLACRYNLRGCCTPECPECGLPLTLGVVTARPASAAWLVGLLSFALPLGASGGLALTATFGAIWSAYWRTSDWLRLGILWIVTIVALVGIARAIGGWPTFIRRSAASQWRWATLDVVMMAVLQGIVVVLVFVLE